ncbi:hypothetical protein UT300019_34400 [Clostridium sp. CTA-19]
MNIERKIVKLLMNEEKLIFADLVLYEEAIDDEDMVLLEVNIDGQKISYKSENFFSALLNLRKELEKKNIQIICNGAAKNIYPSTMQMSMGSGRTAYRLCMGNQAKNSDMVDIFDYDEDLEFANIEEQSKYYTEWLKSIMA